MLILVAPEAAAQSDGAPQQPGRILLTPVSGAYATDQLLTVEAVEPRLSLRYSFREPDGTEGPWISYREPLALSAAAGEEREYRVIVRADADSGEVERRELWLRIDKRSPAPPRILPESGTYWDPPTVRFQAGPNDTVFYAIQGDILRAAAPWKGNDLPVGRPDEKADFVVQSYAVDGAGNRSAIATARYTVDARAPFLEVKSPVTGTFANPQALALAFRNVAWIRYTDDGSDPVVNGMPYTGPVTLKRQGTSTLRIAAQPRSPRRPILRRDVSFTYAPAAGTGLVLDPESGTSPTAIAPRILSSPGGTVYYTLWEKTPAESDLLTSSGIAVGSGSAAPAAVTLRLRALSDSGEWGPEYRYFYFPGPIAVTPPTVELADPEPIRGPAHARVSAPEDALLSVTTDGSQPGLRSPSAPGLVDIQPPQGATSLRVRALTFDASGTPSASVERRIAVDAAAGEKPVVSFAAGSAAGTAVLVRRGGSSPAPAYEITSDGSEPADPVSGSPRLTAPLTLSVPFGMQRTFKVRCASVDQFERILAVGNTLSVTLDREPPAQPTLSAQPGAILDEPTALKINSSAKVYSSVTFDGTTPRDPDPASSPSGAFIGLPGSDGALVTYRVKLAAVDEAGNMSEVYGPLLYTVDLRPPRIPSIAGIADGGKYSQRQVSPTLAESAWIVRYTFTSDGRAPPEPDARSPLLTPAVTFAGEEGSVTTYRLKLLAISHSGIRVGERREMTFAIDLKPPEVPNLTGVPAGKRVARPVVLASGPIPSDTRLFSSVSTGDADPPDPLTKGQPLTGPLTFDVPDGIRRDFTVRIATVDDAGNRSLYDRRYRFTIDRELPDDPVVRGAPEGGISGRPVTLTLESRDGTPVYELTDDGSLPRLPTTASTPYTAPILLVGKNGASVTYRLLARAYNELGTASRAARIVAVTVDRTVPTAPPAPRVEYAPQNPTVAYLAWDQPPVGRILYRLKSDQSPVPDFIPFTDPVSTLVPMSGGATLSGEAVVESPAGVRSPATPFAVVVGKRLATPSLRGARDGAVLAGKAELKAIAASGEVRYEIATDGGFPPTVTLSSPLFPATLALDAADGQTVTARIAARAFDPSGIVLPSDEAQFELTVDRTPPDPPAAAGIEDGGYYQDGKNVTLLSAEGVTYYALSKGNDAQIPSQTDANRYRNPLTLEAQPGQAMTYRIAAFTVDAAGNRSREIRSWTVTIDQKIVYMAPTGNDYADGSRGAPVRSVARALQIAATTSRKTIFAAAGQYTADRESLVQGDVTLVGGLDPETWVSLGLERWSTLSGIRPWISGASLLSVAAGKVSITGFELANGTAPLASLVSVGGGELVLEKMALTLRTSDPVQGVSLTAGTLSLLNCRLQAAGLKKGAFVSVTGGDFSSSGTVFSGPADGADFACIELSGARGATIKGATIDPGAGLKTRGIRASRSPVSISGSRISSGAGSIAAMAIDADQSAVTIENSDVSADADGRSPTALRASGSTLVVSRSRIIVGGKASAVGISVEGGELVLLRSVLRAGAVSEYVSLVRVEEARILLANSILVGGSAGESVCVLTKGGAVDILNDTIVAGTGTTFTAGVLVQGDRLPRIVNTILVRTGADRGAAIEVIGARAPFFPGGAAGSAVLMANSFAGWTDLLRVEYARESGRDALEVPTVDGLNAADGDPLGGKIAGNVGESPEKSFSPEGQGEGYRLARGSACVNTGIAITGASGPAGTGPIAVQKGIDIATDFAGNPRPGRVQLEIPGPPRGWDIGALEFSE